MRCRPLLAALLWLSACGAAPLAAPAAPYPRFWFSGTLRDARGVPQWTPGQPMQMELLPDGSLRDPEGGPLAGFPSPGDLSLFAREPVELHLGSIDGPVAGTASPGSSLAIASYGATVTEVTVHRFDSEDSDLHAFVPTKALGLDHPAPTRQPPIEVPFVWGVRATLRVSPGGATIARTGCAPLLLLDDAKDPATERRSWKVEVVQSVPYDASSPEIKLVGWVAEDDFTAPPSCSTRMLGIGAHTTLDDARRLAPPGFVEVRPPDALPLHEGEEVHWLTASDAGPRCITRRFEGKKLSGSEVEDGQVFTTVYGVGYRREDTSIVLTGPTITARGDGGSGPEELVGSYLCANSYAVVGERPEGLILLHGMLLGTRNTRLFAYHPDDAEIWYHDEAACEQAAAAFLRGGEAVAEVPFALHGGC